MTSNDEIRVYIALLLDHAAGCGNHGCPDCLELQKICDRFRQEIFSGVIYPEMAIQVRAAVA